MVTSCLLSDIDCLANPIFISMTLQQLAISDNSQRLHQNFKKNGVCVRGGGGNSKLQKKKTKEIQNLMKLKKRIYRR